MNDIDVLLTTIHINEIDRKDKPPRHGRPPRPDRAGSRQRRADGQPVCAVPAAQFQRRRAVSRRPDQVRPQQRRLAAHERRGRDTDRSRRTLRRQPARTGRHLDEVRRRQADHAQCLSHDRVRVCTRTGSARRHGRESLGAGTQRQAAQRPVVARTVSADEAAATARSAPSRPPARVRSARSASCAACTPAPIAAATSGDRAGRRSFESQHSS